MKSQHIAFGFLLITFLLVLYILLFPQNPPQQEFKSYPNSRRIELPPPTYEGMTLEEALKQRRSIRTFNNSNLTLQEISQLLFSAQGITDETNLYRTAPSAGALYPIETYLIANRVDGLEKGIYHYNIGGHSLELLREGDFSEEILEACLNQQSTKEAAALFVFTAVFERTKSKYGERGMRYIYIEAGHISQNLLLEATSLNLAAVPIGGFSDEGVNSLIGVDGTSESAVYINAVGKKS